MTASNVVNNNAKCKGATNGSATVSVAGGTAPYTYAWPDATTAATNNALAAGSYIVTATDANTCTATTTVTITEPAVAMTASNVINNNAKCSGAANGSATVSAAGGTAPYTYAWPAAAGSATIPTVATLAAGSYIVTATDANTCTATTTVTITNPSPLTGLVVGTTNVKCKGAANGQATVIGSGGTVAGSYGYLWPDGKTTQSNTTLASGSYIVTISDDNACSITVTVTITEPANALTASNTVNNNVKCSGGSDGSATAVAAGGTAAFTYAWPATAGSSTNATVATLTAGSYIVTITDANSCTANTTVTITEPAVALSASNTVNNDALCKGSADGSATVSAADGRMQQPQPRTMP
jgi:hypothetical protein